MKAAYNFYPSVSKTLRRYLELYNLIRLGIFLLHQVMMYVCEALSFRSSKERLDREQWSYDECMEHVKSQVTRENGKSLLESLKVKVCKVLS